MVCHGGEGTRVEELGGSSDRRRRQERETGEPDRSRSRSRKEEREAGAPDSWSHCLCSQEAEISGLVQL